MSNVCLDCAVDFPTRVDLDLHWERESHGPDARHAKALSEAMVSVGVKASETAVVQRRRFKVLRGGKR